MLPIDYDCERAMHFGVNHSAGGCTMGFALEEVIINIGSPSPMFVQSHSSACETHLSAIAQADDCLPEPQRLRSYGLFTKCVPRTTHAFWSECEENWASSGVTTCCNNSRRTTDRDRDRGWWSQ